MAQSGNGKGIHVVSWRRITEQKVEEGLALHNLLIVKHSLKAKHVFNYLNSVDTIWVSIAHLKYGRLNFGKDAIPRNCSWFFKGLYQTTAVIKPFAGLKLLTLLLLLCYMILGVMRFLSHLNLLLLTCILIMFLPHALICVMIIVGIKIVFILFLAPMLMRLFLEWVVLIIPFSMNGFGLLNRLLIRLLQLFIIF